VNLNDYQAIPEDVLVAIEYLTEVRHRSGYPNTVDSHASWRLVDAIFQVWGGLYPHERRNFGEALDEIRKHEKTLKQLSKEQEGLLTFSYPPHLFWLLKKMFPSQKLQEKKFVSQLSRRYPELKTTNLRI
jgi:hypothetical protein